MSDLGITVTAPLAPRSSTSIARLADDEALDDLAGGRGELLGLEPLRDPGAWLEDRLGQLGAAVPVGDVAQEGPLERLGLRGRMAGGAPLFLEQQAAELGVALLALHTGEDPLELEPGDPRPLAGRQPVEAETMRGAGRGLADVWVGVLEVHLDLGGVPVGADRPDGSQEPCGGLRPAPRPLDHRPGSARCLPVFLERDQDGVGQGARGRVAAFGQRDELLDVPRVPVIADELLPGGIKVAGRVAARPDRRQRGDRGTPCCPPVRTAGTLKSAQRPARSTGSSPAEAATAPRNSDRCAGEVGTAAEQLDRRRPQRGVMGGQL